MEVQKEKLLQRQLISFILFFYIFRLSTSPLFYNNQITSFSLHQWIIFCNYQYKVYFTIIYVIMPAYSIGKQEKKYLQLDNSRVPGVGSYNSNQKYSSKVKRAPSFAIGKSARLKTEKPLSPGPGSYDTSKIGTFENKSKGFQLSGKWRDRIRTEGPGPTSYSIPKIFTSKQYSFGIKLKQRQMAQNSPGPGDYDGDKYKNRNSISFERSKRTSLVDSFAEARPGPTDYNFNISQLKNKYTFSKQQKFIEQQREEKQKKYVPGPGAYSNISINLIKKQVAATRFGRSKKDNFFNNTNIPGPGSYSPKDISQKKIQNIVIGNTSKQKNYQTNNPGPGTYSSSGIVHVKPKAPSLIFGKTQRLQLDSEGQQKLGPGTYSYNLSNLLKKGPSYTISSRHNEEKHEIRPEPCSYSPKFNSLLRRTEMGVIGKDKKFEENKDQTPGPGSYRIQEEIKKSKSFAFTRQKKKQNVNNYPGPGSYQIKQLIGSQVAHNQK